MTEHEFAAGHVFFRPGDAGDRAYLLHDGQVEVLAGADGAFTRVGLFGPGDVFGEMALIEERPRSLTARALTAGRVSPMTRDEFEHLLTHDPARTRQYLRSLFERLRSVAARPGDEAAAAPAPSGPVEFTPAPGKSAGWVVVIHPLTRKAAETLPDEGLRVTRFPLRIGRAAGAHERDALDLNDLWLLDEKPFNVSRNHCEIVVDGQGAAVCDRGSHLGCLVNDELVGGQAVTDFARLEPGENVLVLGGRMSPYQFRVTVSRA
jgi:CRP-like cAMP-binding protein